MDADSLAAQVGAIAALADPVRRALYLYVAAQPAPVTRDQASEAVGVPRHNARFHLDRLAEEGLLVIDFKRPPGRAGPGAGRPNKRYRRSSRQVTVTLPERRYDLAGRLMAEAIEDSLHRQLPVIDALHRAAAEQGKVMGARARSRAGPRPSRRRNVAAVCETLADYGYEPRRTEDFVILANCPFHALAEEHRELVCGMNLALIDAAVAELGDDVLRAVLEPAEGRCCVAVATE